MKSKKMFVRLFILIIILAMHACHSSTTTPNPVPDQESAQYDIRGTWEYTMISSDGNVYDTGTITFSGNPEEGTYLEINIYEVDYNGGYQVNGAILTLTGDEGWKGTIEDANTMSGTWTHEEEGYSGTWTATRQ
jgi:hypothetical protein